MCLVGGVEKYRARGVVCNCPVPRTPGDWIPNGSLPLPVLHQIEEEEVVVEITEEFDSTFPPTKGSFFWGHNG